MRVTIIGSGNVAYSLVVAINSSKTASVEQLHSRNRDKGRELSDISGAEYIDSLDHLSKESDIYIVAVKDDQIIKVINKLEKIVDSGATICHTSAQIAVSKRDNIARLYPLQSFSWGIVCDFSKITFFIETNSSKSEQNIITLCEILGASYKEIDSERLKVVHLAATFANNFTNRMYHYAETILAKEGVDRNVLYPLIMGGVDKLMHGKIAAKLLQTGAAVRRDDSTIEAHRLLLKDSGEMLDIYNIISKAIYDDKL